MKNILIRADSSSEIGTGHIMRDLVLASNCKDANVLFATQNLKGNINHKIVEARYKIEILNSNNIKELDKLIKKLKIDMIIIDHYDINYEYEKQLKTQNPHLTIMALDDTYEKHYCDILLNHNISSSPDKYNKLVPEHCELRCGLKYTLLREEFIQEKQKNTRPSKISNITKVLVAIGGTDHLNINIKILKVLKTFKNIHAHLITTTANKHLSDLKKYVQNRQNISLHINTNHMAKLMNEADFAIVTPSVTVNEALYMELPFIAIKTAQNQNFVYEYLSINNYLTLEEFNEKKLKELIKKLISAKNIQLKNFIDLSLDETKMVLEWRNNQNIRKWMFTQDEISLSDHLKYIHSLKERNDRVYFLVKKDANNIGVISFTDINTEHKSAEFGIYAKPTLKGMGDILMQTIIKHAFNVLKLRLLISNVFEDNHQAIKLYNKHGFKKIKTQKTKSKNIIRMELRDENC